MSESTPPGIDPVRVSPIRGEVVRVVGRRHPDRLSDAQVGEMLRLRRSFENTDLVVIAWDAALVVDPTGPPEDVLVVLELANLKLEEFRWIDRTLDRAYAELGRRRWPLGTGSGAALRALRRLWIDRAKLADEATHVTKFVGEATCQPGPGAGPGTRPFGSAVPVNGDFVD